MEGTEGKAYLFGCIGSIFAPYGAVIEWSYHWMDLKHYFLRMLICIPISIPFVLLAWLLTSIACFTFVSVFKDQQQPWPVSLIVGGIPWAICLWTCCNHVFEIPYHYAWFLLPTVIIYAIDSVRAKHGYPKNPQRY